MSDDSRILQLLEDALNSERTPEEVCADCPEFLWEVRERWKRCKRVEVQIDELFPSTGPARNVKLSLNLPTTKPQIPGYEVEAVLGHGGMGVVYKARHLKLNRTVAIKMILGGAYARASDLDRLMREAADVAQLRHPNIVQVYDVGELDGLPYFTMEYLGGGTLERRLAGTPQSPRRAADLVRTLAQAVQTAHDQKIVHRDLKPSNVLLTEDGTPKITDFGLARHVGEDQTLTLPGARLGTPSYMAPEQVSGDPAAVGMPADVYALGAILYELLTGRPPFRSATAAATLQQVLRLEPAPPSRLNAKMPRDVETICLKCLRKEAARRYSSAAALSDDLTRFLEGRSIIARPLGWGGRIVRWSRREPLAAGLAATALCLASVAVLGGFWLQNSQAKRDAQTARQEGRTWQALEASLAQAASLQAQGRWPEARAALQGTPDVLGPAAPGELRERLRQARVDMDMIAELDDIRLPDGRRGRGEIGAGEHLLYTQAFSRYGIDLAKAHPSESAALIRTSRIRDVLVAFLNDWFVWVPPAERGKLSTIIDQADPDPWRRAFRSAIATRHPDTLRALCTAPNAPGQPPVVLSGLANALVDVGHVDSARVMLQKAQQRHPGDFWINYQLGQFAYPDRPQEAVGYFRVAVAIRPGSDQAYSHLGRALQETGDTAGAAVAFRRALELNPVRAGTEDLVKLFASQGRLDEAKTIWRSILEHNPPAHDTWYGYAQLCLFLGDEQTYRSHRTALLDQFGDGVGAWTVAERTSLACLLLPEDGHDLRRAIALAEKVVGAGMKAGKLESPYLQFLKGLSDFRQGRHADAIPVLRQSTQRLPNRPAPRLVLAMVQVREGLVDDARKEFAVAVRNYDWTPARADHATVWVGHVLRREAEAMVLPDLPKLLSGGRTPRDNDERLALLGTCQAQAMFALASRHFADALDADPELADRTLDECVRRAGGESWPVDRIEALNTSARYVAARCAALAGRGLGSDGASLSEGDRALCRWHARQWLHAELEGWGERVAAAPQLRPLMAEALSQWLIAPDLSGVREAETLNTLPTDEKTQWLLLWRGVNLAVSPSRAMHP